MTSGNHHNITALQEDVLLEFPSFFYVSVAERNHLFLPVFPPQNLDVILGGKWGKATGQAEGLEHVCVMPHQILARLVHSTQHIDLVAQNLHDGHGHMGAGNEALETL